MKVTFKKNYDLSKTIKSVKDNKELITTALLKIREQILLNTHHGKDVNGTNFEEYAESTKEIKKALGKSETLVDLTSGVSEGKAASGGMLQAIKTQIINKTSGKIYFIDVKKANIASYHNEGGVNLPKREFFGISKKSSDLVDKAINKMEIKI